MKKLLSPINILALMLAITVVISGVVATWIYSSPLDDYNSEVKPSFSSFDYGLLYITDTKITEGDYETATIQKTDDTKIYNEIRLNSIATSSLNVEITFFNSTNVSYYYDKTESLSYNNNNIIYEISGILQGEEVPSKTYKKITLTFKYDNASDLSNVSLLSELNFKFTIDKSSITDVVAQSAVDRFMDILNNKVSDDSYQQLDAAMNDRGNILNKASSVTYIGNVAGADSGDSSVINSLFGSEFMNEDLDGDGKEEPITMMIKRLNLDDNVLTGEDYTYSSSLGRETTVRGVEMTFYITAEEIGNADIVVYAATFTKLEGATEWTQLVPLTKGTASTNNYSSGNYGTKNSFNTDTWISDSGDTMVDLVYSAIRDINL